MVDDPKIGTLNDSQFRTWIELLCLATKGEADGDTGMTTEEASWALRRNVTETLQELIDRSLVHYSETGTLVITKWENRQSKSDSSNERVRRHRDKKQKEQGINNIETGETLQERSGNAPEQSRAEQSRKETDSAEPQSASAPPEDPVFISLPLNNNSEHPITEPQVVEWEGLYPAVDVRQELREMRGWLDANPARRKTAKGIKRFITNWLGKEQDRGGKVAQHPAASGQPRSRASRQEL